jgi:hypothetical protein
LVGIHFLDLVGVNGNTSLTEQLLVEVKVNSNFACISHSEGLLFTSTHNDVTEVAEIVGNVDSIE